VYDFCSRFFPQEFAKLHGDSKLGVHDLLIASPGPSENVSLQATHQPGSWRFQTKSLMGKEKKKAPANGKTLKPNF